MVKHGVGYRSARGGRGSSLKRALAGATAVLFTALGLVALPTAATALPNSGIVVGGIVLTNETHTSGQTIVGDMITVSGTWDATDADPQPGDEFVIGLPAEFDFPANISFSLVGADGTQWGTCVTNQSYVRCTLNDTVAERPLEVHGTFEFEIEATHTTEETTVEFDLNGKGTQVEVPGGEGIGDGWEPPTAWEKQAN